MGSVQTHWAYFIIFASGQKSTKKKTLPLPLPIGRGVNREETTYYLVRANICVRFLQIFVPLKKRQEISEFWCAENRAEVIKRMMAGKYASFEPLSANC